MRRQRICFALISTVPIGLCIKSVYNKGERDNEKPLIDKAEGHRVKS